MIFIIITFAVIIFFLYKEQQTKKLLTQKEIRIAELGGYTARTLPDCAHKNVRNDDGLIRAMYCETCGAASWQTIPSKICALRGRCQVGEYDLRPCKKLDGKLCV